MTDVWGRHASQWERVGAPLRPGPDDVAWHLRIARELAAQGHAPDILQLGVTPEIARLDWPADARLVAVDRSAEMIERVWPGRIRPRHDVIHADWMALPLRPSSVDLIVSDGCFGVLAYPAEHRALLSAVRELLRERGRFVFRVFVQPLRRESCQAIYADALAGRIGSFHAFKLRLLMAVQPSSAEGVCTGEVWDEWTAHGPGAAALARSQDWPQELVATIDAYRGQQTRYSFPERSELRGLVEEQGLCEVGCEDAGYELGERCPTLVLRRR